ncbi:MAG: sulfurtransferase [Bradymonadaceae bacterium]|nr:sulfurtransferase [Lujinxingiaceae bacterium]
MHTLSRRHPIALLLLAFTLATATLALLLGCAEAQSSAPPSFNEVFVDLERFEALRAEGAALIDAREAKAFKRAHIPGAYNTPWQLYVDGDKSGTISSDDKRLSAMLQKAGVRADKPVLIYGDWSAKSAWGEEGRVLWSLQYLGKREVYVLQGGYKAWKQAQKADATEEVVKATVKVVAGDFVVARREELRATTAEIAAALEKDPSKIVLLDTREAIEYRGIPKYGEDRAGHIPGARHLWWYEVFESNGKLRSPEALRALFASRGITHDTQIVAYCTGGIRSGFIFAVLSSLGYTNIKNYDASMWEWTAQADTPVTRN